MRETDNDEIVKSFTYNMVNKIKENIQEDGVAFIAIKPNDIQFQLTGGNAGGPITLVGSNKNFVFVWGILATALDRPGNNGNGVRGNNILCQHLDYGKKRLQNND